MLVEVWVLVTMRKVITCFGKIDFLLNYSSDLSNVGLYSQFLKMLCLLMQCFTRFVNTHQLFSTCYPEPHWWLLRRTKHVFVDIYALNLFIEYSGEHWWEQNIFLFVHHTTSILAKLSSWCFEHSSGISCSLLVNPSHTDDSWEGRNTCVYVYIYVQLV